jgi:hypothetical protein
MLFQLSGLQEASRMIETKIIGITQRAKTMLEQEVEELRQDIASKFRGAEAELASYLKIEHEGDSIILSLPYNIGMNRKGKPKVSARKANNPYWPQFVNQPFQDALSARGYIDIEPSSGSPIQPSGSKAPNVRIKAKLPQAFINRVLRG